ncbi:MULTISPECIES: hypothetical protein [Gracilibacillus]|uniref:Spore gernimation protein GerPD n=1 Tax=Gracilibacillus dipsosauri TaxID=178340 RepID=A0A317L1U0_9BACI|nr:hypothetical protein [Gracilibacillus dipsosauri]PWU67759.1 spore gernimation protein GerPD [Gracilibacillus dipsosauri]
MQFDVHNWNLEVGNVSILGISSSSLFIVGDTNEIQLSSLFDTPPESYIVGANIPAPVQGATNVQSAGD